MINILIANSILVRVAIDKTLIGIMIKVSPHSERILEFCSNNVMSVTGFGKICHVTFKF